MSNLSRRSFLIQSGAAVTALSGAPAILSSAEPGRKLSLACVGVGGKGWSDMMELAPGNNIVAVCDIDEERLDRAKKQFPGAKAYTDWRKLLEQKGIDGVMVTTPDHTHAPVTATAMQLGLHCYTQKPLTHSVHEARVLAQIAKEKGLITQMGIQHHATQRLKIAVHAVREDRVIGKVREVHVWTDRPGKFWPQGLDRPASTGNPPATVHWDQWLGTAPERPWVDKAYHPFRWRGWWDFGTGVAGDMGCHLMDPIVDALRLGPPSKVRAEGPAPHPESGPEWLEIFYTFPGTELTTDSLTIHWYEAGRKPDYKLFQAPSDWAGSDNGVVFIGEKGNLFVGFPEMPELFPKADFANYKWADLPDTNHYQSWVQAVRDSQQPATPFSYAGPLTETVLLGNVAYRSGIEIEWDSPGLKVVNSEEANRFLKRAYRSGWEVPGLG